jgi:uncharacterized protein YbcI
VIVASDPDATARGSSLLASISNEMVRAMKEYYGKGPISAKSYLLDDFLLIVMRGGLNTPEKFLLDRGQQDVVRQYRQTFENEMVGILTEKMEKLTGRKVINYQSQVLFDPDISLEFFLFEDRPARGGIEATAVGQIEADGTGDVEGEPGARDPTGGETD